MPEELLVRFCAPTLAGIKTGSMFTWNRVTAAEVRSSVRDMNRVLGPKGLRVVPLRYSGGNAIIYIFRPASLNKDLSEPEAAKILSERGYPYSKSEHCVALLSKKMKTNCEFPHEIGLFLGYPPADVNGFIQNRARNCKCVGYWKVYGDREKAEKLFSKYRKCTAVYCSQWSKGLPIEQLAVAV